VHEGLMKIKSRQTRQMVAKFSVPDLYIQLDSNKYKKIMTIHKS